MNQKTHASHGNSAVGPREVRIEGSKGTHAVRKNALEDVGASLTMGPCVGISLRP